MPSKIPCGFTVAGSYCGLKRNPDKRDISLVACRDGAVAAGVYTQNQVLAAPVVLDRQRTPSPDIRAVILNSGNANACTGERGMADAIKMAELTAEACDCQSEQVLVLSTGIIGEYLPMKKIAAGIDAVAGKLAEDDDALEEAARGFMTTDKLPKLTSTTAAIGARKITICGIAKGAGMIGPRMATMLAVVMTDAPLESLTAQKILSEVVDETFNCISVEGHMSTNDTVLLLASGQSPGGDRPGGDREIGLDANEQRQFQTALSKVCTQLARMIPDDGEGATHLIEIDVHGCATRDDAVTIAQTVANSPLVKTAIAGADPNWGRIVSAVGYAGPTFNPNGLCLSVNGTRLYQQGAPIAFDATKVSQNIRDHRETHLLIELSEGTHAIRFWTSDLTAEYVHINTDYHT